MNSYNFAQSYCLKDYFERSSHLCVEGLSQVWENVHDDIWILIISLIEGENNSLVTETGISSHVLKLGSHICINPLIDFSQSSTQECRPVRDI